MKTLKKLLFFIAGICLLIACSKSDQFWGDDSFGNKSKNDQNESIVDLKYSPGTTYTLSGIALFDTWKVIDGTVLQNAHNVCTAELVFLEKHNFMITFFEDKPGIGIVPFECYGKIASSGILSFKYPAPVFGPLYITDIIKMSSCATIWGPSINENTLLFKGKFDGTRFTDETKFMAKINEPCPGGMFYEFEPINSNLHWTFGHDLTVD